MNQAHCWTDLDAKMLASDVKEQLLTHLPDCDIQVDGEGANFNIIAIGDLFVGLNAVKRQQAVYAALNEQIANGSIHAITMKTFTLDEAKGQ